MNNVNIPQFHPQANRSIANWVASALGRTGPHWRRWLGSTGIMAILISFSIQVFAGSCGGDPNVIGGKRASTRTLAFSNNGPLFGACVKDTPSISGNATMCTVMDFVTSTSHRHTLIARWNNTADRTMTGAGGCLFVCNGTPCKVGNDGLPVELLNFDTH